MRLPEGEKGLLAGVVRTSDTVEINLDFPFRTALGDCLRQTICPFSDQLPVQDNFDPIPQVEDGGSKHNQENACCIPCTTRP
jgi:hypothetical protein